MQLTNFEIDGDYIAITSNVRYLDIHNCFDYVALVKDEPNQQAELVFIANTIDCSLSKGINGFSLLFENVEAIYEKGPDPDYPAQYIDQDKTCVDLLGFSYDGDEMMDGPLSYQSGEGLSSLIFVFVTGAELKITATKVSLRFAE